MRCENCGKLCNTVVDDNENVVQYTCETCNLTWNKNDNVDFIVTLFNRIEALELQNTELEARLAAIEQELG